MIARQLSDSSKWHTHGRSITMQDLEELRLKITDYSQQDDLADAVRRYFVLLRLSFELSGIYKVYETPSSHVLKHLLVVAAPGQMPQPGAQAKSVEVGVKCEKCGEVEIVFAPLEAGQVVPPGKTPFPKDNKLTCRSCATSTDLIGLRRAIEAQCGKPIT